MDFLCRNRKKIAALVIMLSLYFAISWHFASVLVAFKVRSLDEDRSKLKISSSAQFGVKDPLEVHINREGIKLEAWYVPGKNNCGIILHHGFTGTRYGSLKYAPLFADQQCHLLLIDARHHGRSQGDFGTYGYFERHDLIAWVDYLRQKVGIDDAQIGLLGVSFGGATVLLAGAMDRHFWFLIADSPYKDLRSIVEFQAMKKYGKAIHLFIDFAFQLAALRADFEPDHVSPLVKASGISSPVMLIHSMADDYTPVGHSVAIFQRMTSKSKDLFLTDWGAAHARSIDTDLRSYVVRVEQFLQSIR